MQLDKLLTQSYLEATGEAPKIYRTKTGGAIMKRLRTLGILFSAAILAMILVIIPDLHSKRAIGQSQISQRGNTTESMSPMEWGTNRYGQDYKGFELEAADPKLCQTACANESMCKAWTYVKENVQGPKPRCWLKHSIPSPSADSACVSGTKITEVSTPQSSKNMSSMEWDTNRYGQDYRGFELEAANPTLCQNACANESTCQAWTYVKENIQGPKPRCWLKHSIPSPSQSSCCVSGTKIRP